MSISEATQIIDGQLQQANLQVDSDYSLQNGMYAFKAYDKKTKQFKGTFYVRKDRSWYFIDSSGDTVGPDAPRV